MILCPLCGDMVTDMSALVLHLHQRHEGWRQSIVFPCPYCTYQSDKGMSGVQKHIVHAHPDRHARANDVLWILSSQMG